ncbi:ribonuclease H-like domain-containing protein [Tanacetum coccineum]
MCGLCRPPGILASIKINDIIFGSTKKAWCDEFEALLKGEFEMSAMGELTFFLGLQVQQRPDGIFISQDKYVQEILKKFDLECVKTATTPYEAPKPKSKNEPDSPVNVHLYRSMIGSDNESDDASVHSEATIAQQQQNIQPQIITTVSNNNAKFPYLKKDEYEVWAMKMEYWITNNDMNIWKVIQNGNSLKRTGRDRDGRVIILPPTTADEHIAVQRESKARTTLLQSIPDDHVADFHYMDDARDIWNAVKARFGGNAESKKMRKSMLKQEFSEFRISEAEGLHKGYDRMQKILSQLNQLKAKPEDEDINLKFLRALPSSWSQVALTLKTKGGLELLSFDDLYYKLKTLEVDIKGYSTFSSSQSAGPSHSAFVSTTSASKKMSYADSPSYSSSTYTAPSNSKTGSHRSGNVIEDVLQSFVADTEPKQQLAYEDFEQIEKLDLEEMDLKWKMAMLSVRVHKFEQKVGRKIDFDKKESARFNKNKVRCYKCLQRGHFARECRAKGGNDKQRYSSFKIQEIEKKEEDSKALITIDTLVDWTEHDGQSDGVITPKEFGLIAGCDTKDVIEEGATKIYNLITGADTKEASTAGDAGEFALMGVTSVILVVSTSESEAEIESNVGTPIQEPIIVQDLPSFSYNSSDKNENTSRTSCNKNGYFNKKAGHFRKNASSVSKTGKVNIPPARQQPVPTGKPKVPAPVPTGRQNRPFPVPTDRQYSPSVTSGWWKSTARPMPHLARPTSSYFQTFTPYVPQMYYNHMKYGGVRWATENPYSDAEDEGIFDSGCSRSMTGNMERLDDFQEFQGGKVTFGGGEVLVPLACLLMVQEGGLFLFFLLVDHFLLRQFVKNQSSALYSTGWTKAKVESFTDALLKEEFEKTQKALANTQVQAFNKTLKRTGPELEEPSSKQQKSTESTISSVPDVPQPPVVLHPNLLAQGGNDKTFIKVVSDEDSTDEAPILWSALAGWEVISTPLGEINALYRSDQSTKHFTTLREILHMVDRQDLLKLYGMVVTYYENHLVAGAGLMLWGDLQVLIDSQEGGKGSFVWNHQSLWQIRSWRLYTLSNVHVLETVSGEVLYMFADVSYPLSVKLMERMLKHKLEIDKDVVGNDMTTAEQLIRFIKNQIAAAQVSPV